jgi:hypothetical protein
VQLIEFAVDDAGKDGHQALDLVCGAFPIFGGKGVYGQYLDAEFHAASQYAPDIFGSGAMTGQPGEASLLSPSPVAIHDYAHMVGYSLK